MRQSALIGAFLHLILPLASAVSLSDFQELTVNVKSSCNAAYDQQIPSCTVNDFKANKKCSSGCVSGLNRIASGVLNSCGGTIVGSSTLLGRIFDGAIISSLCPNNDQTTSAAQQQSSTAAPATSAKASTQEPAVATSSTKVSSAAPTSSSISAPSSSSPAAEQSSSSAPTAASSSATAVVASSASSSATSSAAAQTSQAQTQPGNGRSGLTVPQQQIAAISKSGGGSPFDIVGYSAGSHPTPRDMLAITLGLALLLIGWLMR